MIVSKTMTAIAIHKYIDDDVLVGGGDEDTGFVTGGVPVVEGCTEGGIGVFGAGGSGVGLSDGGVGDGEDGGGAAGGVAGTGVFD